MVAVAISSLAWSACRRLRTGQPSSDKLLKHIGWDRLPDHSPRGSNVSKRTSENVTDFFAKTFLSLRSTRHALSLWTKAAMITHRSRYGNPTTTQRNPFRSTPSTDRDMSKYADYDLNGCYMPFPQRASTLTKPKIRSWKAKRAYVTSHDLQDRSIIRIANNFDTCTHTISKHRLC